MKRRHILIGAALAAWAAGLGAAATQAQETNSIVGPPELRDFELPGSRTTPPPAETQPVETPPPPVTAQPEPPRAAAPVARARTPRRDARPAPAARETPPPQPAETVTAAPAAADPAPTLPAPGPSLQPPAAAPAPAAPGWLGWLAVLAGVLIAAGGFFVLRRKERAFAGASAEPAPAEAAAEPASAPIPAPAPAQQREPRPWLELSFKPARAAATDSGAVLHYELTVRNVGQSAARNVRIDARMFNAGADQDREIGAFFSATAEERDSGPLRMIMPGGQVPVRSTLSMPKEHVREYKVQGRSLFIPMVAFNVVYEWGEGRTGKTSMSYLVGQEAQTPSQKMGAFRLDLGPRIYRTVGQRQHKLAQMV